MPGSHDWRKRAASQIAQPLPDNTADAVAVLNPRAVDRHIWPKAEYERALDLINRGYDKLIVAQIIGRTLKELNNKLHYEQMEESKRQQRHERINELRKRAPSSTPDGPRKNYRIPARAVDHTPAIVFEERKARQAVEYRDLTSEFFGDPRPQDPASPNQPVPSSPPCRLLSTRLTPFAQRSREATKITEAISAVLAANSETNLLEIEEVFRDAGSSVYLIAEPERTIVIGMSAVRSTGLACRRKKADMRWQAFTTADQHSVRGPPCGAPGERKIPPARCPRY